MPKLPDPLAPEHNPDAFKHLFGKAALVRIAEAIGAVYPAFDRRQWLARLPELETLEMKPRVRFLREALRAQLPTDYPRALRILLRAAREADLEGFVVWPFSDFVQTYGLEHVTLSLDGLRELTSRFSSEFAVRPFLTQHPRSTVAYLERCARARDVDVRRWASEGSRPRLPWGERLQALVKDPSPTARILEALKFDPELYVRKSVANHLNDITKDHPERVIELLTRWQKEAKLSANRSVTHSAQINWIVHRSLRSLIKAGHPGALRLIGVGVDPRIELTTLKLSALALKLGDRLEFGFKVRSRARQPQKLVIDYIVHFMKANQSTSPKVFKLKTLELPGGAEIHVTKSHHLKRITTRVYHAGAHRLEIQINGKVVAAAQWKLSV